MPVAIASATPGAIRSRSARFSTTTLDISTAIAGAAVVRNCLTAAVCAVLGDPLNRCASNPCTKSPSFPAQSLERRLRPVPGYQSTRFRRGRQIRIDVNPRGPRQSRRSDMQRYEYRPALRVRNRRAVIKRGVFIPLPRLNHLKSLRFQRPAHLGRKIEHDFALANPACSPRSRIRPAMRRIKNHDIQPCSWHG